MNFLSKGFQKLSSERHTDIAIHRQTRLELYNTALRGWSNMRLKAEAKASDSYIAHLTGTKPDQPRFTIIGSGS